MQRYPVLGLWVGMLIATSRAEAGAEVVADSEQAAPATEPARATPAGLSTAGVAAEKIEQPSSVVTPPTPPLTSLVAPHRREGVHSVEFSYLGYNFNWPGFQVGYSYRPLESRQRLQALVVGVDVGSYYWPRHDIGVFILPRIGWRGRHRSGLQGEVNMAIGYAQSIVASESFDVVNGQVVSNGRPSYPLLMFGPSLGVGWFLPRWGVTPFARVGALFQYPNFDMTLIRFHVTAGVEVRL